MAALHYWSIPYVVEKEITTGTLREQIVEYEEAEVNLVSTM